MITKIRSSTAESLADLSDGATLMIGGFGLADQPVQLIYALLEQDSTDLTVVSNNAGNGDTGLAALIGAKRVKKIICSFPHGSVAGRRGVLPADRIRYESRRGQGDPKNGRG
jgi:3-oxoadipate CoA-transferase, alpha subunit